MNALFLLGGLKISNEDDCSHSQSQFIFPLPIFCSFRNSNDLDLWSSGLDPAAL